jgi:hypothetical protein
VISGVAEGHLRAGLKGRGIPEIDKLEVAPLMRVTLFSDPKDFEINSLSSTDQYMRLSAVARCWVSHGADHRSHSSSLYR